MRGAYVVTGEVVRPMTDELMWAVLLGDAIHNLRSALDHLIWQLVLLDTGKEGSNENQFPIVSTGDRYWSTTKNGGPSTRDTRLRGVSEEHRAIIDACQPYRILRPKEVEALAALRDLSNHDKHRLLHVLLFAVDIRPDDDFRLIANDDAGPRIKTTLAPFPKEGENEVMVIEFSCPGPNPHVDVEGDIAVGAGIEITRMRLTQLPEIGAHVSWILEQFQVDFA